MTAGRSIIPVPIPKYCTVWRRCRWLAKPIARNVKTPMAAMEQMSLSICRLQEQAT